MPVAFARCGVRKICQIVAMGQRQDIRGVRRELRIESAEVELFPGRVLHFHELLPRAITFSRRSLHEGYRVLVKKITFNVITNRR